MHVAHNAPLPQLGNYHLQINVQANAFGSSSILSGRCVYLQAGSREDLAPCRKDNVTAASTLNWFWFWFRDSLSIS